MDTGLPDDPDTPNNNNHPDFPPGPIAGTLDARITQPPYFNEFRIVIVGPAKVGKTALANVFANNHFIEEYEPTIQDSFRKNIIVDEFSCFLTVMDTSSSEQFARLVETSMRLCQGFLLVFSLTDRESFEDVQEYLTYIYDVKDAIYVPIIIAANKCDLASEQAVSVEEAAQFGNEKNIICFLTSAKDRYNVEECFAQLVREIVCHPIIHKIKKKSVCSLM